MKYKTQEERNVFLEEQYKNGAMLIDSLRRKNSYDGLFNLLRDFYPDNAHILYELLQNAEDAGATEVTFELESDVFRFIHNGRPFNEKDIEGITGIGNTTKKDNVNAIGTFGIGFKAVFHYTDSPNIYSRTYSFGIIDKLCPVALDSMEQLDQDLTLFVFPFDSENKKPIEAFEEIQKGLEGFVPATLLFLRNIQKINWQVGNDSPRFICREKDGKGGKLPVFSIVSNAKQKTTRWLRFSAPCKEAPKQSVCIAFEFVAQKTENDKHLFRIGETSGKLCIFFPAEKESTNLRFHLHAPFASTPDRASIKDQPENSSLRDQLVDLLVGALPVLRDEGLLTTDFLGVLPNDSDGLNEFYEPFMSAVVEAMKTQPLVPIRSGGHEPAQNLTKSVNKIHEIISDSDLEFITGGKHRLWVSGVMRNFRPDQFLSMLGINNWSTRELLREIVDGWDPRERIRILPDGSVSFFSGIDEKNLSWLRAKSPSWKRSLFLLLANEDDASRKLSNAQIIPAVDGSLEKGRDVVFYSEDGSDLHGIKCVHPEMVSGKQQQKDKLRAFLEELGVSELDEKHYIQSILQEFYSRNENENLTDLLNQKHMKRFVKYWDCSRDIEIFAKQSFLLSEKDGKKWYAQPGQTYLDRPLCMTGLDPVFQNSKYKLSGQYTKLGDKFLEFAKSCGVQWEVYPEEASAKQNSQIKRYYYDRVTKYEVSRDYRLPSAIEEMFCERVIGSGLQLRIPNDDRGRQVSLLIWKMMCSCRDGVLEAGYSPNDSASYQTAPSQLVQVLRSCDWVPAVDGNFYKPSEMTREQLRTEFVYDDNNGWLTAIGFGHDAKKRVEKLEAEEFERQEATKLLRLDGIDLSHDEMVEFSEIPKEERRAILEERKEKQRLAVFPESVSKNSERRSEKTMEGYDDAPSKTSEKRERAVRTSRPNIDPKPYLQDLYTNDEEQLVCQMCELEMPFTLRDGEYYFEAVQLFDDAPKETHQVYLAMCPVCAAKYKWLVKKHNACIDSFKTALLTIEDAFGFSIDMQDSNLEPLSIRFTETHLLDVRTVLGNEEGC